MKIKYSYWKNEIHFSIADWKHFLNIWKYFYMKKKEKENIAQGYNSMDSKQVMKHANKITQLGLIQIGVASDNK